MLSVFSVLSNHYHNRNSSKPLVLRCIMTLRFVSEQELAETYDDGWETINQYQKATHLRENNPEMARAEIARRVGRPPSAIRGWLVEDKTPRVLKGIREAQKRGWIDVESSSEQFRALNQLVAWIFSGGGVGERTFVPHFSIDDPLTLSTLDRLLQWMNLPYRIDSDRPNRGQVVIPKESAALFGRLLSVLGVPMGVKSTSDGLTLPGYLSTLSEEHQRDFLRIYILNRGRNLTDSTAGTYLYALQSEDFCRELKGLIESVTTGTATLGKENEIWVSSESVRDLAGEEPVRTAVATRAAFGTLTPPTERAFASTYRKNKSPGGYRYMEVYEQVMESDKSRSNLASQIDGLREPTIQSWRRGSKPYVRNGIETIRELGWVSPQAESDTALGLTGLLAWAHARGTIRHDSYYPVFTIDCPENRPHFKKLAKKLDLKYELIREEQSRSTEIRISENGSALGRVLNTLGVPLNDADVEERSLPAYLYHRTSHARQFVTTWCEHYAEGDEELEITVPLRLGKRFADGLMVLLIERLSWKTTRTGDCKFRVIPDESG